MQLLFRLAEEAKVAEKIEAMFAGAHLNTTEDRAVRPCPTLSAATAARQAALGWAVAPQRSAAGLGGLTPGLRCCM